MKKYLEEYIDREKYISYLKGEEKWNGQYVDIDTKYAQPDSKWYCDWTKFLNCREGEVIAAGDRWEYTFLPANDKPGGIQINAGEMILRMDTFGFSAAQSTTENKYKKGIRWDNRYPYGRYLNLGGSPDYVADVLFDTRTLGGAFVWPIKNIGQWTSLFNMNRGVLTYIEDRVDLTLYEVKKFYHIIDKIRVISECDNKPCVMLSDVDLMGKWLSHFGDFETFIKFFCLDCFVDKDYNIADITRGNITKNSMDQDGFCTSEYILNDDPAPLTDSNRCKIFNMNKESLEIMLGNLRNMIVIRSELMEEKISKSHIRI